MSKDYECDVYVVAQNVMLCFVFVKQLVLSWKGMVEKDIWNGLPMI